MKLIYSQENRMLVSNAQNILQQAGIETLLKNEFASSAAGDLSPFDTWLELWLVDASDFERAEHLLQQAFSAQQQAPWLCPQCGESNAASFDFCWQCQSPPA
jgi:hypothetical protein